MRALLLLLVFAMLPLEGSRRVALVTTDQSRLWCKPSGPIEVGIEVTDQEEERIASVHFRLRPVLPLSAASWELLLPAGVELLDGPLSERWPGDAIERTVRLRLPQGGPRRVTLVASGTFFGSDELGARWVERTEVERTLLLGAGNGPASHLDLPSQVELGWAQDPVSGRTFAIAQLPGVHRSGR